MINRYLYFLICPFLVIFLTNMSLALDCDYTTTQLQDKQELALSPEYTVTKSGDILQISDFIDGEKVAFTVDNPNSFEVEVEFTYNLTGDITGEDNNGGKISSNDKKIISKYCIEKESSALVNCKIDESSIAYKITKPFVMIEKEVTVQENVTVCKMCPSGEICKNDDVACGSDKECGYGSCNFAKYCGKFKGCPEGTLNCNNQSCLKPSVKNAGEAYSCVWECESGQGHKNICSRHWTDYIIILAVFLVLVLLIIKRIRETITGKDIEKLKNELRNLNAIIENKTNQLENLEQQKNKTEEDKRKITELTKQVDEDTKKYKEAINKNDKVLEEYTKERKSPILGAGVYEWKNPRKDFYPCYVNQGIKTDKLIHKNIAETKIFNVYPEFFNQYYPNIAFDNLRVHHIDRDVDNYRVNNLIIISQKEHDEIKHSNIHDYASGIVELKRVKIKAPHIPELNKNIDYQEQLQLIKDKHPRAYELWEQEEENTLKKMYNEKESIENIAKALKRQPSAIRARLKKIGLIE